MCMDRRASSLASHATLKAAAVAEQSHRPSLCVLRGGGGTSCATTASRTNLARNSTLSDDAVGLGGEGSVKQGKQNNRNSSR